MSGILIIEDEESVRRGMEFTLRKEGYSIYPAGNLREGTRIYENNTVDLIICDINLPDGSGLDWVRKLRKSSEIPVIFLTALDQEADQVMGYETGADDYITKPFSLSVLALKVNAFFKRKGQIEGEWIDSGMWRFHLGEMCGVKGEERVTFTKNEWKLLRLFLDHPKQILSKTQILEQVFDVDGEFFDENTVAVNIRRLREKIEEKDGSPEYIRNVRGLGYLWNKECIGK